MLVVSLINLVSLSQQDEFSPKAGVDDISNLDQTISRTISKLKLVKTYIENVIKGSEKPDEKIGQFISDTLYSIPRPELGELKILVLKERNQIGLSKYLSELARAQMSISDKIAQI